MAPNVYLARPIATEIMDLEKWRRKLLPVSIPTADFRLLAPDVHIRDTF